MTTDQIRARRDKLESDMRAEGATEPMIQRLATEEVAAKMLDYEQQVIDQITSLFGPAP